MFSNVKEVIWVSKILLSKEREDQIKECFVNEKVDFKSVETIDEFDDLLEHVQKTIHCNENSLGENIELDRLIVLDDISRLPDRSETIANFLAVSRKFGLTCVYVFHTLYPTRQNLPMTLAQTKIFNIFPGSVQTFSILKILSSFSSRYKYSYVPCRDLWINRLYSHISSSSKKHCLTIHTRDVNELRPAKFRTQADKNIKQICYYNRNKKDKPFNSFLAIRKQTLTGEKTIFSIEN